MRQFVRRYRFAYVLLVPALLIGCKRMAPAGEADTMTLLREGSQKVCVAEDVTKSLHDLIVPKATDLSSDYLLEARAKAIADVSLSYSLTTLQSFDAAVTRATCNTSVEIKGAGGGAAQSFDVTYAISPAADSPGSFVVAASARKASVYATALINEALQTAWAQADDEMVAQVEAEELRKLLATVNEKWLRGAWITASADAASCGNGEAVWFENGHVLEGGLGRGRWTLTHDKLHLTGDGFDATGTISAADPITYVDRVMVDVAGDTEDMSSYDTPLHTKVEAIDDDTMHENGERWRRCAQ